MIVQMVLRYMIEKYRSAVTLRELAVVNQPLHLSTISFIHCVPCVCRMRGMYSHPSRRPFSLTVEGSNRVFKSFSTNKELG